MSSCHILCDFQYLFSAKNKFSARDNSAFVGMRNKASPITQLSLTFLSESHSREQTHPSPLLLQKIGMMENGIDTIDSFSFAQD